MLPFRSLDLATATGPGSVWDLEGVGNRFTAQVLVTGSPTFALKVEGSLDGTNWDQIEPATITGAGFVTWGDNPYTPVGNSGSPTWAHNVRYVRANLVSLTGGTSPTITVWIAAADVSRC